MMTSPRANFTQGGGGKDTRMLEGDKAGYEVSDN